MTVVYLSDILYFMNAKRLSRFGFENLIYGDWKDVRTPSSHRRENGKFRTWIRKPWKFVSDGTVVLRAKSWDELAKALELV